MHLICNKFGNNNHIDQKIIYTCKSQIDIYIHKDLKMSQLHDMNVCNDKQIILHIGEISADQCTCYDVCNIVEHFASLLHIFKTIFRIQILFQRLMIQSSSTSTYTISRFMFINSFVPFTVSGRGISKIKNSFLYLILFSWFGNSFTPSHSLYIQYLQLKCDLYELWDWWLFTISTFSSLLTSYIR